MTAAALLYPPSPAPVPVDLAVPTRRYRVQVVLVLASLILFLLLYAALVASSAYLAYWSLATLYGPRAPYGRDDAPIFWLIVLLVGSVLLFLFLLKGFFKGRPDGTSLRVEVTEKDQPELFAFIHQVCRDTQAPRPHRVFLTPDVNAAVVYHSSFLSLFLPTPKNLIVGLGLVNRLNLSEFKAVLAHEFGHFSQSTMKLGSYVYMANHILADIVYGRDWLDDLVGHLRRVDIRIALFAWGFTGLLWCLRKVLEGSFRVINFANAALLRQMEFNADLVAVRVTGSDALIFGLSRLNFASEALGQAWHDLTAAADHRLYTRDLFYHQTRAADYLRRVRRDPHPDEPPALPEDATQTVQVFQPSDTAVPLMWATHPSNYDREQNAKRRYLRSPMDERSPWLLFRDAERVREQVTRQSYQLARKIQVPALADPEIVQAFIDDEHAETSYDIRYHGLYDDRYLRPGDLDTLLQQARSRDESDQALAEAHARLYGADLPAQMAAHRARLEEHAQLQALANGTARLKGESFSFRQEQHPAKDVYILLNRVEKELKEDDNWLNLLDCDAFLVHDRMALRLGADIAGELEERYRFHLAVQEILSSLSGHHAHLEQLLGHVRGQREVPKEQFAQLLGAFRAGYDALYGSLTTADRLGLPPLKNVTPGEPLSRLLIDERLVERLNERPTALDGAWVHAFLQQLGGVCNRARRIHFKSLGGILALQEQLAEQFLARTAVSPV